MRARGACPQDGETPLHYAAFANRDMIVIELLRAGASTEIANKEGKTAKEVAQALKLPNIVELIVNGPPPLEPAAE